MQINYWGNVGFAGAGGAVNSQALAGFNSQSGTATEDIAPSRDILVSRARQLDISSPLAQAAIDRMASGIVGAGLDYAVIEKSEFFEDDVYKELSDRIKKSFKINSMTKMLDAQRRQTFKQMQELACRNWLLSGDIFFVRFPNGEGLGNSWRAIEADRCVSPSIYNDNENLVCRNPKNRNRIIDGVELDKNSRPVAYWILKDYVENPLVITPNDIERIPAFDPIGLPIVIHLFKPYRPDQYRGVPLISNSIETLHSVKSYIQAELQAAQFQSSMWAFVTSSDPVTDMSQTLPPPGMQRKVPETVEEYNEMILKADQNPDVLHYYTRNEPKYVNAGQISHLGKGEDIKFLQSSHPNSNFASFVEAQNLGVASSIGIPIQVLECSYNGTYASARGSVLEANRTFKIYRSYFIEAFIKPVFEVFCYDYFRENIDWAESVSKIADPIYLSRCMSVESVWQSPSALCLDPVKEIEGWQRAIELGLATRDEAAMAVYGHKAVSQGETENV